MKTEVCIIGAGPAGSTAALYLSKHGIRHVIIDKATFPRNVVCGEALRGSNIYWALKHLDEGFLAELKAQVVETSHWIRLTNRNRQRLEINLGNTSSLMGRRIDFDNFLIAKVKKSEYSTLLEGQTPKDIIYDPKKGYQITLGSETIHCKILICATGATSTLPQKLHVPMNENRSKVLGMRAHYRGVALEKGATDIYFLDILKGGYFWIFPLFDGYFNVGMAVKETTVKANNWQIKELFQQCLAHKDVRHRFEGASLEGKAQGKFLFLPDKKPVLSAAHLLIAGAAGMAVNPITGYGVGHSMTMGRFAALHAVEAIAAGDFSAAFLKTYDKKILKKLKSERKVAALKTALLEKDGFVTGLIAFFGKAKGMRLLFARADFAANFYKPLFYLKHFWAVGIASKTRKER